MRIITTSKSKLRCHHAAKNAYLFSHHQKKQFNVSSLEMHLNKFRRFNPLPMVIKSTNKYLFISGWNFICYEQKSIKAININTSLADSDIECIAWNYVIRTLSFSLHRKTCLKSLHDLLEELPSSFNIHRRSKINTVIEVANESRGAVRSQIGAISMKPNDTIFTEIGNG